MGLGVVNLAHYALQMKTQAFAVVTGFCLDGFKTDLLSDFASKATTSL